MSVLVKGMKMPDSCYHCKIAESCGHYIANYTDRRHPDCPLIALPEHHGRLVDEDDVINAIHERLHELQTHKEFIKKRGDIDLLGILPYIAKIQAIIEAEDGE